MPTLVIFSTPPLQSACHNVTRFVTSSLSCTVVTSHRILYRLDGAKIKKTLQQNYHMHIHGELVVLKKALNKSARFDQ